MGQAKRDAEIKSKSSPIWSSNRTRLNSDKATYSANPPARPWPMPTPERHRCSCPLRHRPHFPQALVRMLTTLSPTFNSATWLPVCSTTPEISWPRITPGATPRRKVPDMTSMSWWQKPHPSTRTRTSSGPGWGMVTSFTDNAGGLPGWSTVKARITR